MWLITGVQASGKSTIADLLARTFARGAHVRGGEFYRWAVTGWEQPGETAASDRARELLDLRYRLSAQAARKYVAAGFTAVVQDNIYGADVETWLDAVEVLPRRLVLAMTPRLGLWLDTSAHSPDETVREILRRADEAVVD